ncbi:hypothetical protein [Photobacterium carnosum]|uniref:hypothetical protein n=1 Tax=Photobacterium carnosum TaxID=2023717 RepID=UPI00128B7669|nr:hypothetical protein [Photobacterium carnosum]MCD9529044.1 hypothetical protein [Photobacterium carnosum]MCD9546689.1 hypothetical protein [Photobacterium carnosum]MCD9554313.1 hypothetical protein [Photobacterium carnosum]MCF2155208.1 hypothetical protein [Photobacterium carnosum]MCF2217462.1 hypothetical protein [Photobacterium carnosum]
MYQLGTFNPSNTFTLGPNTAFKQVLAIINNKYPKVRYYVTQPIYIFGFLRRVLPMKWLDKRLTKRN